MPINFPNSPSPNQQYTYDNKTWEWNGIYWEVYSALTSYVTYTIFNSYTGVTQPLIYRSITGGTYSGGTLYLTNNSGTTIQITGFTAEGLTGNYLPLSGGTVTGATNFTAGLTANTISATTYYNLPIDIRVTGGTYSNGNTTFINNTGGTFTVTGSATYSSGILSGSSNWVSNGNGSVTLPTVQVALYNNSSYTEPVQVYTVSSGVTGSGGIAVLTNNDTNYIYIEYNNGSPRWGVSTDNSFINGSDVDLCYLIYRADNFVHVLDFGNEGAGLPNKISNRIVAVNRFGRESGFSLGLSGATGVVTLTSGVAWNGTNRQSLVAVNSQDDIFFKSFHSGGTWVYTTTGDTINNTYYDDGTDIVLATASKYLVNWYFRGQEINDHLYEVYGTDEYDSVAEAQLSVEPVLPELITSHAFLTGRIIVQVSATTGSVESAFVQVFQSTQVTQHNDLISIQGGTAGEYYHLTASEYSNNAYTNVDNNFSVGQTISGGLIVDTISATTISGDTLYGDGSNLTNIPNIYNIDGSLTDERTVTLDSNNLIFRQSSSKSNVIIDWKFGLVVNNDSDTSTEFSVKTSDGSVMIGGPLVVDSGDITLNNLTSDNLVPYLLGLDVSNLTRTFDANYIYNSITGGTFSTNTLYLTNNTGGTVPISGFTSGSGSFTGGTVSGPTNFTNGLTSNTISATTYQNLPATPFLPLSGGTVSGFVRVQPAPATNEKALFSISVNTSESIALYGLAGRGTNAYGVYCDVSPSEEFYTITNGIGGYFEVGGQFSEGEPTNKYSLQLKDGTEGLNKVLTSVTSDGKANWSNTLNVSSVTATTITSNSVKVLPVALTVVSNTASTDASLSSIFTLTLTGNTTLSTPTNGFSGQRILYRLKQDGTGNKLLTLSSGFRTGPITVTLSTTPNTTDYLGVIYNEIDNEWDVLALNKGYN